MSKQSGDDEDYKRIYTKKIKPRLKSEDLAEGVDVRTERHSSTSSDGSTITTVTRRITTYTVDLPPGISEHELLSPEHKGLRPDSEAASSQITIPYGNLAGKTDDRETGSTDTRWGTGSVHTRSTLTQGDTACSYELGHSGSGNQEDGDTQTKTNVTLSDGTNTGSRDVKIERLRSENLISVGENGGSISMTVPGKYKYEIRVSEVDIVSDVNNGPDVNVELSKTNIDTKVHKVDTERPAIDMKGPKGRSEMAQITMPSYNIKGQKIEMTNVGINLQKGGVEIERPGGKVEKITDLERNLKGPNLEGDVDISVPKMKADLKMPSFGIKGNKLEGSDIDISRPKAEVDLKTPKLKGDINTSGTDWDIKRQGPQLEGDVDVSIQRNKGEFSSLNVGVPDIHTDGAKTEFKMPKVKIPSFGNTGPKMEGADVDISLSKAGVDIKAPKLEGDISVPKIKGDISAPEVDVEGPDINIEGPKGGFKIPKVKMPSFDIKGKKWEVRILTLLFQKPVQMPSFGIKGPKMEGPDVDITPPKAGVDIKAPKFEGDISIPKIKGEINAPDIDVEVPDINIEGSKGGFKMAKVKMPSFGIKVPEMGGPDVDITLPKAEIGVKEPKLEGDISIPKIKGEIRAPEIDVEGPDINIEGSKGGFKMPKVKMPSFGIKGPKMEGLDVDITPPKAGIDLKAPKLEGDISVPKIKGEINAPEVDVEVPDINIEGSKGGFKMPKVKMPSFGIKGPKMEGPDVDITPPNAGIDLKAPKLEGNISVPKIKGEFSAPEVDVEVPDINIEGSKGGFKMPKVKMPSFDIKGQKIEGPDVDITLPKAEIDVKAPTLEGDISIPKIKGKINAPEVDVEGPDINIEGSKGGFKMPKVKMPSFGIKGQKMEGPDVDIALPKAGVDLKAPKLEGDISVPKIKGEINAPNIDVEVPDINIEGSKGGFKMPKVKMPSFDIKAPKMGGPDVDITLPKASVDIKEPKLEGDISVPKTKGEISAPEIDVQGPDLNIEGSKGGFKMPKVKMPSFGIKVQKMEGPDVDITPPKADIDLNAPKLEGNISVPKIKGEISAPEVDVEVPDINIEGSKGGFKMPKVKMPSFDIKGPKMGGPDVDITLPKAGVDIKEPKLEGDISIPKIKGEISVPEVDVEGPDINIDGSKGGFKMPKVKMPSFGIKGPKMESPDVDITLPKAGADIKAPKLEGDISVPKIKGEINAPDIDFEVPDINIEGSKGGFKMPKVKMPSFDIKAPKLEGPDVDISLPKAEIDVKAPKLEGDISISKIKGEISAPEVDVEGPEINIEGSKGGFKMPKVKMPSFGIKGQKMEGPDVNITLPKAGVDIKAPKFEGDISVPKIKGEINAPDIDIEGPDINIEGSKGGFKMPKVKMPSFDIKAPKLEGPDVGISLPKAEIDVKAPKLEGDISIPKIKGEISAPEVDVEGPEINIEGSKGGFKMPKVKCLPLASKVQNGRSRC
uniref:AHNAK nucleoprotein n=1 Tax=Neogobius melanostomus TaxID=47308 RepID=A0A8C6U752_9GOBI